MYCCIVLLYYNQQQWGGGGYAKIWSYRWWWFTWNMRCIYRVVFLLCFGMFWNIYSSQSCLFWCIRWRYIVRYCYNDVTVIFGWIIWPVAIYNFPWCLNISNGWPLLLFFPLYHLYRMIHYLETNKDFLLINQYIMFRFTHLIDVRQQQVGSLNINGWLNTYQWNQEISYTPMGGSLIINVLVYTHNGGSPITSSMG